MDLELEFLFLYQAAEIIARAVLISRLGISVTERNLQKMRKKKLSKLQVAVLAPFLEKVKKAYPKKDIWCYTGYVFDKDILPENGKKHCQYTRQMIDNIDTLVDGPFKEELKDISLKFRGSSNQRILDLKDFTTSQKQAIVFIRSNNRYLI